MLSIKGLMETYGLTLATFLLFLATYLVFIVAKREHKLRTNAHLGFGPIEMKVKKWRWLELTQEVFNTGVSFVSIEEAFFEWNLYLDQKNKFITGCNLLLPQYLPPGRSMILTFHVDGLKLALPTKGRLSSIAEAISGSIIYKYKGTSNEICCEERSADLPVSPARKL